jgi:hypothetical protein
MAEDTMRKTLFALVALVGCADNSTNPGDDDGTGSDDGSGGGGGSDDGSGDDGTSAVDRQQDYDDVAALVGGNLAAGDFAAMVDAVNMAYGRMPADFTITQGPDYQILTGTRGGLSIEYKLFCRDTADLYTPCNGFEDHAHVNPKFTGSVSSATGSMDDITRKAAWTVRDLALANVRIGGAGTHAFAATLTTGSYVLDIDDKLDHVRYTQTPGLPMAGFIELVLTVERNRAAANPPARTFNVIAKLAFDGTDVALLTLDSTQLYSVTLSTGVVVKAQ